jgi:hypothetical protein
LQKPTFRGNGVDGRAEPIEKNRLEELTWIVTRWASRFADIKDAGPECAEQSLDSGRRKEWKTPALGHAVRVSMDPPQERPGSRDGGAVGAGFLAMAQGNAPKGTTAKILRYKGYRDIRTRNPSSSRASATSLEQQQTASLD